MKIGNYEPEPGSGSMPSALAISLLRFRSGLMLAVLALAIAAGFAVLRMDEEYGGPLAPVIYMIGAVLAGLIYRCPSCSNSVGRKGVLYFYPLCCPWCGQTFRDDSPRAPLSPAEIVRSYDLRHALSVSIRVVIGVASVTFPLMIYLGDESKIPRAFFLYLVTYSIGRSLAEYAYRCPSCEATLDKQFFAKAYDACPCCDASFIA